MIPAVKTRIGGERVRGCGALNLAERPVKMVVLLLAPVVGLLAGTPVPAVADRAADRFVAAPLERQRVGGVLGERLKLHVEELIRQLERGAREGSGDLGTLLEAGARIWPQGREERLKSAMDRAFAALAAEGASGQRGATEYWRRQLSGLLSYYAVSGEARALTAARRQADALSRNGHWAASGEAGIAPLLEPACVLFRYTGERRQLTQSVTRGLEDPGAPRLLRTLAETGSVYKASRGRAEETLNSLAGLVELYRLTGAEEFLKPAPAGWEDIVARRLYVTGAVSAGGRFLEDGALPGEASAVVGEAGATAAWLRLNWQLLRSSGEARYADEIERTVYNHLMGMQEARSGALAGHVPLAGRRSYARPGEGPAGALLAWSLAAGVLWGAMEGGVAVALYAPGEGRVSLGEGLEVRLEMETRFPQEGRATLTLHPTREAEFPVYLRAPWWTRRYMARVGATSAAGQPGRWLKLARRWRPGDRVEIEMEMTVRLLRGDPSYPNQVGIQRGPQVLVLEREVNPGVRYLHRAAPAWAGELKLTETPGRLPRGWPGSQAYTTEGMAVSQAGGRQSVVRTRLGLVPFGEAKEYRVWMPTGERLPVGPVAVTAFGEESWSEEGGEGGSICDERADTYRTVKRNGTGEHWYAVEWGRPELIQQVVYRHGKVLPGGGWFDTSRGKPQIQIKRRAEGPWETVAVLENYPEATSARAPALEDGQAFEARLPTPVMAVGVRVVGRAGQGFSSCAELAAYAAPVGSPRAGSERPSGAKTQLARSQR